MNLLARQMMVHGAALRMVRFLAGSATKGGLVVGRSVWRAQLEQELSMKIDKDGAATRGTATVM